jgi:hypothetical protein
VLGGKLERKIGTIPNYRYENEREWIFVPPINDGIHPTFVAAKDWKNHYSDLAIDTKIIHCNKTIDILKARF